MVVAEEWEIIAVAAKDYGSAKFEHFHGVFHFRFGSGDHVKRCPSEGSDPIFNPAENALNCRMT